MYSSGFEDLAGYFRVRSDCRYGLCKVFQEQAHGNGSNQSCHVCAFFANRPVSDEFCADTHKRTDHNRRQYRSPCRQPETQCNRHSENHCVTAHHDEITVSKVDQAYDAIDHRISKSNKSIDTAEPQPDNQCLKKSIHRRPPISHAGSRGYRKIPYPRRFVILCRDSPSLTEAVSQHQSTWK